MTGKLLMAVPLLAGLISVNTHAADPCKVVLCMYGKAVGSGGGSECNSSEKAFFDIVKKKKGSVRWDKTFDARKSFLNQCSSADPAAVSKIMSKFGKVKR